MPIPPALTDAEIDDRSATLRTALRSWADQYPDIDTQELFAHILNLAFQIAFTLGSEAGQVAGHLHGMVDKATEVYGPLAGTSKPN